MVKERKIKVVYIINSLVIGGAEKVMLENYQSIDKNIYDPYIISLSPYREENSIFSIIKMPEPVKLYYFDFDFGNDYSIHSYVKIAFNKNYTFKRAKEIITTLDLIEPDILHFNTTPRELPIGKIYKKTHPLVKLIFTDHALRVETDKYGPMKRFVLRTCFRKLYKGYHTISVSRIMRELMAAQKIHDETRRNIVLENGIEPTIITRLKPTIKKDLTAVYVARISQVKEHNTLIKAWALLGDIKDKKLFLVGSDELNGSMQYLAESLGCKDSVIFTGAVSNPFDYILEATIGVFPSHKEGLPLSLLEKMATGLPVVVSGIPELASVVKNNYNGLVFETGNAADLAEKIRILLKDAELRNKLGNNARISILENYNAAGHAVKLQKLYNEAE